MEKIILTVPDQRMLELLEYLKASGDIRFRQQFLDTVGMLKQDYRRVLSGHRHFSPEQIAKACDAYNENANWILGVKGGLRYNSPKANPVKGLKAITPGV